MTNHLLILHKPFLERILAGTKTVESRLSVRRHPAAGRLRPGDQLYFKEKGGDIRGRATTRTIHEFHLATPADVQALAAEWSKRVGCPPDDPYWRRKANARHALLIELANVEPFSIAAADLPRSLPWASAWIVGHPQAQLVATSDSAFPHIV